MRRTMAKDTFVVEVSASRHLDTAEIERALLRLNGVSEVQASNPEAEEAAALQDYEPVAPPSKEDYEEPED